MTKVSSKKHIQHLLNVFAACGVLDIVCSPGSRNAPLMVSFAEDSRFQTHIVPDERSAGFIGLGMCTPQSPVVLVCTSGSAAINYGPAISEAFFTQKNLIALTADRPLGSLEQWESQTINQSDLFRNYCSHFIAINDGLPFPKQAEVNELDFLLKSGPVQLNYHLSEPLYEFELVAQKKLNPIVHYSAEQGNQLPIPNGEKVLFLFGQIPEQEVKEIEETILSYPHSQTVFLSENTNHFSGTTIDTIDTTLSALPPDDKAFVPDTLVTYGRLLISRKIKQWLKAKGIKTHLHFHDEHSSFNPFLSKNIQAKKANFNLALKQYLITKESGIFDRLWYDCQAKSEKRTTIFCSDQAPYSDLLVFNFLNQALPKKGLFHVANSSAIRYFQLFGWTGLPVYCNRGVSGIDGSNSTAWGHAAKTNKPTYLITGDISFHYDSNFAWNSIKPEHFKVILINNGGGGIFRFIPGPDTTEQLESHFEFSHKRSAENWAQEFGFPYYCASNLDELKKAYQTFIEAPNRGLLEIFTPPQINGEVLRNFFKYIAS
ncbi:MAG: 2-succinyl-5-enolpyruvyl-6-hydroxy-3-cyclohexene-1-carboxylate synthase [Luteibaculaceae bacterium]|jgi:2-succinyl-5-enolpyruvyl-6-hydroxy-3-cyclohexene-1-carboxylate synthase